MLLPRLRSLNMLILAGFALVSLPLIFAIALTTSYVDRLADRSAAIVADSVRVTRNNQIMLEQIISLERNARQYHVLGDPELLNLYRNRHERLLQIVSALEATLDARGPEIPRIKNAAQSLLQKLQDNPYDSPAIAAAQEEFAALNNDAYILAANIDRDIDSTIDNLQIQARALQQSLYWQAAALTALALALATLFAVLISKPVRELGNAIIQLGKGEMNRAIAVRGPVDLEVLGQRLDWLRTRLHGLEQEKNKFLSHVSHELKTPLANIREGAELLRDGSVGPLGKNQYEVVDILQANSLILQKNIENLLNFSAWQDMKTRLQYNQCRLREIVKRVLKQHKLSINRLNLKIDMQIPDLKLYADRSKLEIVLDNLISNAVKFSPSGSTIHLKAVQNGDFIVIHVADEGPGIPVDERTRVFEAFYQGRQSHHGHVSGTGIGLAVARE
ncbi:MAG TPA: HAMP domain-containing sensor histidine kinase, partial [Gammaproteobacteria bacterium]